MLKLKIHMISANMRACIKGVQIYWNAILIFDFRHVPNNIYYNLTICMRGIVILCG
jgi:hypothetical protein